MSRIKKGNQFSKIPNKSATILLLVLTTTVSVLGFNPIQVEASESVSTKVLEVIKKAAPSLTTNAKPAPQIKITINNKPATLKDPIVMENGRVFLPVRNLGDLLGVAVDYQAKEKVATAQNDKTYLELPLGYNEAVKDKTIILPIDANNKSTRIISYDSRTYLPVRFISENLGYQIGFAYDTVSITTDGSKPVLPTAPTKPVEPTKPAVPEKPAEKKKPTQEEIMATIPKPTSRGKKDFERSKDGNWTWASDFGWVATDHEQDRPPIVHPPIVLEGPNGNWN